MRGAPKDKKIWDRVDSEGKYGRWKLQDGLLVMSKGAAVK